LTRPDAVVVVHPLFNHFSAWALRSLQVRVPLVTVVTDLVTTHPGWICPDADLCLVPSERSRQYVLDGGMSPDKVKVTGLPISLKFLTNKIDKLEARKRLGLAEHLPTVLLVSGGEGMGPVYKIARAISSHRPAGQMVIVAGRNQRLRKQLERTGWEIPTKVLGFVDNMPELMRAADVIVTKAGPSTISEAFIAGLPIILSGFIPGQEEGNVDYVVQKRAGVLAEDSEAIGRLVAEWFEPANADLLAEMTSNSRALGRPEAALNVATEIHQIMDRFAQGRAD
jgi:1,2-diacylglycerol 3-beta-galactosyltransferase